MPDSEEKPPAAGRGLGDRVAPIGGAGQLLALAANHQPGDGQTQAEKSHRGGLRNRVYAEVRIRDPFLPSPGGRGSGGPALKAKFWNNKL